MSSNEMENGRTEKFEFRSPQIKVAEISEDEIKDLEDELQKITDKYVAKIDKMVEAKSKEIMTV